MPRKSIPVLLALFCAGLVLAVAGCGGDSTSSADTAEAVLTETTETTETEAMEETTETETEAMETVTEAMETVTEAMETTDDGTSGGAFSMANEDCQELANVSSELSNAFSGGGSENFEDYVGFLNELADRAPEEIADDFRVLAEAYAKIAEVMDDVDPNDPGSMSPEQLSALMALGQELNQGGLVTASTNISTWMTENCTGVSPSG